MSGPWEKYQQPQESGPWARYAEPGESVSVKVTSGGTEIGGTSDHTANTFGQGVYETTIGPLKDIWNHQQENVKKYGPELAGFVTMYDLGKGVIKASNDEGVKTLKALGNMSFGEAIQHLPGIIPGLGPAAVGASEQMEQGNVQRGMGQAAGLIGTSYLGAKAPQIVKGVGLIAPKASEVLRESAQKNYLSTLLPSRKASVPAAEATAAKMAEAKIIARSKGALQEQAQAGMKEWGPKAGTAFQGAQPIQFNDAFNVIETVKDKYLYVKGTKTVPANRAGLEKFFNGAQEDLVNLADPQGNIPAQILDNYVDDINKGLVGANQDYRVNLSPKTLKKMEQSVAGAFRTMLDQPNPGAAQINSIYSMYARINQFVEESRRAKITARSGIVTGSSKGFGALTERLLPRPIRELPKDIAGVFDSVPWNTLSGATKGYLADAMARGNWNSMRNILRVTAGTSFAGQSMRSQDEPAQ